MADIYTKDTSQTNSYNRDSSSDESYTYVESTDEKAPSQKAVKTYVDSLNIPTSTSDLTNDSGFITSSALSPYALTSSLATVATTGSYNSLSNKPTIPTTTSSVTSGSTAALTSGGAYTNLVRRKSTSAATGSSTQGVYVNANGQIQTCTAVTSTYAATGTAPVNGKAVSNAIATKQDNLVSGTNIKTINGNSLLGSGNITIETSSTPNVDSETISYNSSDALQTIAVKNKRDGSTLSIWQGTETQWNRGVQTTWYYWETTPVAIWSNGGTLPSSALTWEIKTYGNGRFIALKSEMFSNYKTLAYSDDGITWSESSLPSKQYWRKICYGDGKFVAFSTQSFAYSTDGINWTESNLSTQNGWISVCYGNNKFVAIDTGYKNTTIAYSGNGIDWTTLTLEIAYNLYAICYGDGKFVALPNGGTTGIYSTDGINWTEFTLPRTSSYDCLVYGNNKFLAKQKASIGNSYIYSTDGINWTEGNLPYNGSNWYEIAYGDGKFVVVGNDSGKSVYSTDGINWTESLMPSTDHYWRTICYGDGKFVSIDSYEKSAYFSITYTKCYTDTLNPTVSSKIYSEPATQSILTISSITSGAITLSDNNSYYYNQSGNAYGYQSIGDAYPDWLCFINGVGVKIGNTTIASI